MDVWMDVEVEARMNGWMDDDSVHLSQIIRKKWQRWKREGRGNTQRCQGSEELPNGNQWTSRKTEIEFLTVKAPDIYLLCVQAFFENARTVL